MPPISAATPVATAVTEIFDHDSSRAAPSVPSRASVCVGFSAFAPLHGTVPARSSFRAGKAAPATITAMLGERARVLPAAFEFSRVVIGKTVLADEGRPDV